MISNVENAAATISGISAVEVLTEPPYDVGTRWRETRRVFGTTAVKEMRVIEVVPQRRTVVEAESSGTHYTTTFTLEPDGEGTLLTIELAGLSVTDLRWHTLIWRLFGAAGMRAARKEMQTDLDDIAAAAGVRA